MASLNSMMQQGGAGMPQQQAPPVNDGKLIDLTSMLEKKECYARNESSAYPMTNLFIGDTRLGCKSDADEQLILHLSFHETVKVRSMKLTGFNRGLEPESNPTTVKVYVNRENMGFEDCEDMDPTQAFELTEDDLKEDAEAVLLKYVKFQRVKSFTIFVEDNGGGDVSALGMLKLFGTTVAGTNMKDFKKQG